MKYHISPYLFERDKIHGLLESTNTFVITTKHKTDIGHILRHSVMKSRRAIQNKTVQHVR
jgi:hypothetical protein